MQTACVIQYVLILVRLVFQNSFSRTRRRTTYLYYLFIVLFASIYICTRRLLHGVRTPWIRRRQFWRFLRDAALFIMGLLDSLNSIDYGSLCNQCYNNWFLTPPLTVDVQLSYNKPLKLTGKKDVILLWCEKLL
jgi:hypothetical protein